MIVKRVYTRNGFSRYRVMLQGRSAGLPYEFLIQTRPRSGPIREWQALFARCVANALLNMAHTLESA